MILEAVILNVIPNQTEAFERNFRTASTIICKVKYLLLIKWETLEDHTVGFRNSAEYQEWKNLLHHVYDPHPVVEHFNVV